MSETRNSRQSRIDTEQPLDAPGDHAPSSSSSPNPTVTELFTILGDECEYLPYDPDAVCRTVMDALDGSEADVDVENVRAIAKLTEACTDVEFPDLVITRAEITLQDEYSATGVTTVLHLMSAHGKSIADPDCPVNTAIQANSAFAESEETRAFNTVRTLRVRTVEAVRHLATTISAYAAQSRTRTKSLFTRNKQ